MSGDEEATLDVYGREIVPAFGEQKTENREQRPQPVA
jgi:hypothetical protein